ncbi:MAPEG family protein, partial [Bacteriovoracaceae bacterium]|nr:MAPEG family protein [Bacteriovoracaceae bacterium]
MILYPCFALFLLTLFVLIVLKQRRLANPKNVTSIENANRNVINLHETPIHFLAVSLFAFIKIPNDLIFVYLAWGFVFARVVHTMIQL